MGYMSKKPRQKRRFSSVEVAGVRYDIKYKNFPTKNNVTTKGELDPNTSTIWLSSSLSESEETLTLIHEILHAIIAGILPAPMLAKYAEEEEVLIEPFSRMLTSALRSCGLLAE